MSGKLVIATTYVTEACAKRSLACLAANSRARLLYNYVDTTYERSSYCVGGEPAAVAAAVVALAKDALGRIDLRDLRGSHPTIGVVDHVAVNPLGDDLAGAAATARAIAGGLADDLPALFYGAARDDGRGLAATRRLTAYFGADGPAPAFDAGPAAVDPKRGVLCVGAVQHVLNYNVLLGTADGAAAKRVAAAIRARGGGPLALDRVEAMALAHDGGYEVACNLLDAETTPPARVLAAIEAAAAVENVAVAGAYHIGMTKAEMRAELAAEEAPFKRGGADLGVPSSRGAARTPGSKPAKALSEEQKAKLAKTWAGYADYMTNQRDKGWKD